MHFHLWYVSVDIHSYTISARAPGRISICSTLMSAERLGCVRFEFTITWIYAGICKHIFMLCMFVHTLKPHEDVDVSTNTNFYIK